MRAVLCLLLSLAAAAQNYQLVPNLTYDQALGLQLDLYLPRNATPPYPTVVWIHGGAWQSGSRASAVVPANQLCPRGYAVVGVSYRLSGVAQWPAQLHDCKGAIRWLRANAATYGLDGDRFGAWGSSAGGHLVACLGTMHGVGTARFGNAAVDLEGTTGGNLGVSSRVQAVCDWFGPTEFVRMREFPSTFDHDAANSPESLLIGGAIQTLPDRCATANPIPFLTPDDAPLLIMHGTDDTTVPYHQSELLYRAATLGTGLEARFVPVPNTGHGGPGFQLLIQNVYAHFDARLRDLPAIAVSVVASDGAADEAGDVGSFTLTRTGSTAQPLLVAVWASGTAELGSDCEPLPQLVQIAAGALSAVVAVRPLQDSAVEGSEAVTLRVCASLAYRVAAAQDSATVSIADDDASAGLPVVTLSASDATAAEPGNDTGALVVTRTGSTVAPLTVTYRVRGTALAGLDFAALPLTVTIPAQATSAPIPLVALDDGLVESGEYVTVSLRADATYALGANATAGVVIADDDRVASLPIVSVSVVDITAGEAGETGTFSITRTGPTTAPLTVPFRLGGRATLGADFGVAPASPATIPAGVAWARVVVSPSQDGNAEGDESVSLAVAAGASWQLAGQSEALLQLADDDAPLPPPALALALAPVARGGSLTATVASGAAGDPFALWLAAAPAYVPFQGGVFGLDPTSALALSTGGLAADGSALVAVPVPDAAELLGAQIYLQVVALQLSTAALRFSNAVVRRFD
jgi:acetyl esterase/lipase